MLKQFNINKLVFDEPIINTDKDGHKTYSTSGDDWYPVDTQEQVDRIWQSVSEGGTVWTEDGELKCSGPTPSPAHKWQGGKWKICKQTQADILAQNKTALLLVAAAKAEQLKEKYLAEYPALERETFYRQEQEARGTMPLMLLEEIFAGGGYENIEQLKAKIIDKADTLAIIEGALITTARDFKTRIEQATTQKALDNIRQDIADW